MPGGPLLARISALIPPHHQQETRGAQAKGDVTSITTLSTPSGTRGDFHRTQTQQLLGLHVKTHSPALSSSAGNTVHPLKNKGRFYFTLAQKKASFIKKKKPPEPLPQQPLATLFPHNRWMENSIGCAQRKHGRLQRCGSRKTTKGKSRTEFSKPQTQQADCRTALQHRVCLLCHPLGTIGSSKMSL